jgi:hypothetical protein
MPRGLYPKVSAFAVLVCLVTVDSSSNSQLGILSVMGMFQQLSGLQPRHHVPSLKTESNKSETDRYSKTGEEPRSDGAGRNNPPVRLPALVPTPYRNSLRGWVSIHFTHKLANVFPREQIKHES